MLFYTVFVYIISYVFIQVRRSTSATSMKLWNTEMWLSCKEWYNKVQISMVLIPNANFLHYTGQHIMDLLRFKSFCLCFVISAICYQYFSWLYNISLYLVLTLAALAWCRFAPPDKWRLDSFSYCCYKRTKYMFASKQIGSK